MKAKKCPLCDHDFYMIPPKDLGPRTTRLFAISRRDNKTYICDVCGENESKDWYRAHLRGEKTKNGWFYAF